MIFTQKIKIQSFGVFFYNKQKKTIDPYFGRLPHSNLSTIIYHALNWL